MGVKDQTEALKWIQTHIAAFSGDKSKVTIFGTSSGAADVILHMLSPMSKGLFHAAISQSGTPLWNANFVRQPIQEAKLLGGQVGCPVDEKKNLLKCLQDMDSGELLKKMGVGYLPVNLRIF